MPWNYTSAKRFQRSVIAKAESNYGWNTEGYLAIVDGDFAGVIAYAYDSVEGDFNGAEFNDDGELDFLWVGTPQELLRIAILDTDLMFPDMARNVNDCDYEIISRLYREITKWAKKKGKK